MTKTKRAKWLKRTEALQEAVALVLTGKFTPQKATDKVLENEEYISERENLTKGGYDLFVQQIERTIVKLTNEQVNEEPQAQ